MTLTEWSDRYVLEIRNKMERVANGALAPEQALDETFALVREQDTKLDEHFEPHTNEIIQKSQNGILQPASRVVDGTDTPACLRALFAAGIFSLTYGVMVSGPGYNRPPEALMVGDSDVPACAFSVGDKLSCSREISTRVRHGGYDNCPAVHAAEQLQSVVGEEFNTHTALWVEAGAISSRGGGYQWWKLDPDTEKPEFRVYPCLQCMRYMMQRGVRWLCAITNDGDDYSVSFHDIALHSMTLLLIKTAVGMESDK